MFFKGTVDGRLLQKIREARALGYAEESPAEYSQRFERALY
jgi:hypothetical protein